MANVSTDRGVPSMGPGSKDYESTKYPEQDFPILPDGTKDYLKVDPPRPGQNWVLMSFVSPNDMIEKRNLYYFNQFLYAEVNKSLKDQAIHMAKEVNVLLRKAFESKVEKLKKSVNETDKLVASHLNKVYKDLEFAEEEFAGRCMHLYKVDYEEIHDKFTMFRVQNSTELDKKFDQENDFACSVRGFKVRGVFNERKEAELKATDLRDMEPAVDVFVTPVGYWCPWDPDPDAVQDSEYMVPALNEIMGKYHQNVRERNKFFQERKQENVEDANMSNRERIKARLRQKLIEQRQAKMEAERKQKRADEGVADEGVADEALAKEKRRQEIVDELLKSEEKEKKKKSKSKSKQ